MTRPSRPISRNVTWWVIAAFLLSFLIAAKLINERAPQYHANVVVQTPDSLTLTFLNRVHGSFARCQETARRIAATMFEHCAGCRVVEETCLTRLDARQRKILSGDPLDIPVMRIRDGAVAFVSGTPDLAIQACRESERLASARLPAQCAPAGPEGIALSLAKIGGAADSPQMPKSREMLYLALIALAISWLACWLIIGSEHWHGSFSHDVAATGPQKFHSEPTPRIGGLGIGAGLAGSLLAIEAFGWLSASSAYGLTMLALSAIPAFAGGFAEDVTKRVGPLARLMLTFAAGVFASLLVGATIDRLDVPGLDFVLQWPIFAVAFTAFAVGGVANSINIIDGYNGLAGGYSIIVLAALAWVAEQVGDPVVFAASLAMLGTLLGFLVWNYPRGRIFMGDGGAYLLGFWLAELSVLLVVRNPDVSPWFPLVLMAYPVFETLFSIYRRTFLRKQSSGQPDALHIHQLIYRHLAHVSINPEKPKNITRRNSMVASYVWAGTALFIAPSLIFWTDTYALMHLALLFAIGYVWLYWRLSRWPVPAWLIMSRKPARSHSDRDV